MQSVSSSVWTRVAVSMSYDDNHYTTGTSCVFMNNEEHVYIKYISLVLFSKGAHSLLLVWEIDGETYTQRGDFLSYIFFREPVGASFGTPLQAVSSEKSKTSLIGCISLARLPILWTNCLNLTAWFSYHEVSFRLHTRSTGLPRYTAIPLFTNHNVTACQSTWGHQEWTENPCHMLYYLTK